jgi:hypothetical protein
VLEDVDDVGEEGVVDTYVGVMVVDIRAVFRAVFRTVFRAVVRAVVRTVFRAVVRAVSHDDEGVEVEDDRRVPDEFA